MLPAKKSEFFQKIFSIYNRNLIKRRFMSLKVEGFSKLQNRDKSIPHVIYANHSSWWDGLVMFQLCREAKIDLFAMMEEKQVLEYPFHRKIGAFSVVRENPRDALKAIKYASNLLKENSERCVLIFPQGELVSHEHRPIVFFNGISKIVEKTEKCFVVPVAIRYQFLDDWKPEILVSVGDAELIEQKIEGKELTKKLELNMTKNLDSLSKNILDKKFKSFERLV
jgi:1-acyl-sn-glycerol-3-phosphate acyltransferase